MTSDCEKRRGKRKHREKWRRETHLMRDVIGWLRGVRRWGLVWRQRVKSEQTSDCTQQHRSCSAAIIIFIASTNNRAAANVFFHRQLIRLLFSELINQSLGFKMYKNHKKTTVTIPMSTEQHLQTDVFVLSTVQTPKTFHLQEKSGNSLHSISWNQLDYMINGLPKKVANEFSCDQLIE